MRTLVTAALCALALMVASCNDTPTATSNVKYGKTTIDEMMTNTAYRSWYETGYSAYPDAGKKASFDSAVALIASSFDPATHSVLMVVKPNCGCPGTQLWMPRAMKTLDAAGIPHDKIQIYTTDNHLTAIDDVKTKFDIKSSADLPAFFVLKNDVSVARVIAAPAATNSIEQELAAGFVKP